jgi:VWFA-related protein
MKGQLLRGATLAALLVALPGAAQPRPEEPADTPVFLERLEVEIVNLDVVVTDAKGNPVEGLTREEFELRVDGEPTPIDNFYAVGPEQRAATAPEEAPAGPAEEAMLGIVPPAQQELHLLVLFDNRHATPGERKRVANDLAAAFEPGLEGRGRAAVAYYDGGIKVSQPFTADGAALGAAIRALGATGAVGYSDEFDRRNFLREIEQVELSDNNAVQEAQSILGSIEIYGEQKSADVRLTLAALASQVDALAGLPGRKVLLYITSGLDLQPTQALFAAWRNKFGQFAELTKTATLQLSTAHADLGDRLREVTRRANAGRVSLYAIGTAGAGPAAGVSAEEGAFDFGALDTPGGGRNFDATVDSLMRANLGSGLELMAAVTGGDALTGSGNYDLIAERVQHDAGYRYSLGFRAPDGEPGVSHRMEVEVPGYKVRLRYRREFVTATPAERASERTLAALLWGHADNSIGVAADFYPAQPSDQGKDLFVLPILVKVPFVNLVLLPERRFHRGQITIFVVAEDEDGRLSPVQSVEAPIRIPTDRLAEALGGVGGYRVGLLVRRGPHRLAIGVRDEVGDVVSTIRLDHDVVSPGAT